MLNFSLFANSALILLTFSHPISDAQTSSSRETARSRISHSHHSNTNPCQDHTASTQPSQPAVKQDAVPPVANSQKSEIDGTQRLADYTWWLSAFTAFLAFVSMGQGFFLYRQARYLREHARHFGILATAATDNARASRDTAEAALKQASTMANAERAWVVETITFHDHIPRRSANWDGGVFAAQLTLMNIGKQPAMVHCVQSRFHATEALPTDVQYSDDGLVPDGYLLAPGEVRHWQCVLDEGSLEDSQVDRIEQGSPLGLYIYGRVLYHSVGVTGINQFCYKWLTSTGAMHRNKPLGFQKDGPPDYNKHT
jgi:hypothetical protein